MNELAAPPQTPVADFESARQLFAGELIEVDGLIDRSLASDIELVDQVARHLITAGGKRLRPLVLLMAAAACGKRGAEVHTLAAVIEFIHTATLLHDDVVDGSDRRRGRDTANAQFGNAASVLVGDFLYSRAFQMMVALGRLEVMRLLADTTNKIAEGEVLQLLHVRNPFINEAAYFNVVERKTAVLFAAAAELGGMIAGAPTAHTKALREFGLELGFAFQIADDVLDFTADPATLGKNLGDDLAEGKATLPLIHAIAHADGASRARLSAIVQNGDAEAFGEVIEAIDAHGSLGYARRSAAVRVERATVALQALPVSAERDALAAVAYHAIERTI